MAGGRIRTLKPELLEDEIVANLSIPTKWLFVSCILIADDYGNLRANPGYLQSQAFWNNPEGNVVECLEELCKTSLVDLYQVRGQNYLHISGWDKHQKIDKPGKAKLPSLKESLQGPYPKDSTFSDFFANSRRNSEIFSEKLKKVPTESEKNPEKVSATPTSSALLGSAESPKPTLEKEQAAPTKASLAPPLGKPDNEKQRKLVEKHLPAAEKVLETLNQARMRVLLGAKPYKISYTSLGTIAARLEGGASVEDCAHVVAAWETEVKSNPKAGLWFKHDTPFRPDKFTEKLALEIHHGVLAQSRASPWRNQSTATEDQKFSEEDLDALLERM